MISLHEEIGHNARFNASLRGFDRVTAQAGGQAGLLHHFESFAKLIQQAPIDEGIRNPALDVHGVGAVVNNLRDVLSKLRQADVVVGLSVGMDL